jgi:hypothetical protein
MDQPAAAAKAREFIELLRLKDSMGGGFYSEHEDPRLNVVLTQINLMRPVSRSHLPNRATMVNPVVDRVGGHVRVHPS